MLQSDEREILIDIRFEKADENLKTARLVFDASPDNAASAAYYCVLHSIQALFLQHGISTTKKRGHRSGIDLFNRNFVHAGVFSKEIGAIAGQLETMRNIGVYAIDREVSQDEALLGLGVEPVRPVRRPVCDSPVPHRHRHGVRKPRVQFLSPLHRGDKPLVDVLVQFLLHGPAVEDHGPEDLPHRRIFVPQHHHLQALSTKIKQKSA